jgi:hypothetical protein
MMSSIEPKFEDLDAKMTRLSLIMDKILEEGAIEEKVEKVTVPSESVSKLIDESR